MHDHKLLALDPASLPPPGPHIYTLMSATVPACCVFCKPDGCLSQAFVLCVGCIFYTAHASTTGLPSYVTVSFLEDAPVADNT